MKMIIGLGNPGPRYAGTRHNVGFLVAQRLAKQWAIPLKASLCQAKVGQGQWEGLPVAVALPQTSMNVSGESVACLVRRFHLEPAQMLVICDDVSLPLGSIRLRGEGSDGGHNGLASVLGLLHRQDLPRLRVGIGSEKAGRDLIPFVLGRFSPDQRRPLEEGLTKAVAACEAWVARGTAYAMNRFNQKVRG